jgi:hypothetical protein
MTSKPPPALPHCERLAWFGGGPECRSKGPFRKVRATAQGLERDFLLCEQDARWIEDWDDSSQMKMRKLAVVFAIPNKEENNAEQWKLYIERILQQARANLRVRKVIAENQRA